MNGREEDNSQENLIWTCRPCNVRAGNRLKQAGISRLTRQYNPGTKEGAQTMGQWVNAVTSMKGEGGDMPVREAVAMIRATPASRRSKFAEEIWHKRGMHGRRSVKKNPAVDAAQYRLAQAVLHGTARTKTGMTKAAAKELIEKTPAKLRSRFMKQNAGPRSWRKTKKAARKRLGLVGKHAKRKRNPESSAVAAYVDTHGKQPGITIEVDTPKHYHSTLAGMGKLEKLIFAGGPVKSLDFGKGTYLAMNEKRTQLFIVGGDQSVNLRDFGITQQHETEILGPVREVVYYTEKRHLIEKDGGRGSYGHKFKLPLPVLVYDVRNKLLSFAGGGYSIPSEGIKG